jgi:hypothetical protein
MEATIKQTTLYDFPKDILIKMICNIETDMKKELETKKTILAQVIKLTKIDRNVQYQVCNYTKNTQYKICDNYIVSCGYLSSRNINKNFNPIKILSCETCSLDFCEEHLIEICSHTHKSIWICDNCYKHTLS